MSSSNFGTFSGTIPSLVSMISSRRLVSVSLRDRSSIVNQERGQLGDMDVLSLELH